MPKVIVKDYGLRKGKLYVKGEIHLSVSYDFYAKRAMKYNIPKGNLIGGVDVNTDRINLAIVDERCRLRDKKTFRFPEVTARGFPRDKAWSIIGMKIHDMLRYAYHHGVSIIALENPSILGRLRLIRLKSGSKYHRNYNWKVSIFRSKILEVIAMKAPLYSIKIKYVNPKAYSQIPQKQN